MAEEKPLNIPVILGTTRVGRTSAHVARFVTGELEKRAGVVTELIDIKELPLPVTSAGEDIKDPGFSKKMEESDALVIVAPEYNHSFPGLLKHVLDSCLEEYIHKAAGVVGVSSTWSSEASFSSATPVPGAARVEATWPSQRTGDEPSRPRPLSVSVFPRPFTKRGLLGDEAPRSVSVLLREGEHVTIVGRVASSILERDARCKMIGFDPDTAEANPEVLRRVALAHEGNAGVYGEVLMEGTIRRGDAIELLG